MVWLPFIIVGCGAYVAYVAFHLTLHPMDKRTKASKRKALFFQLTIASCIIASAIATIQQGRISAQKADAFEKLQQKEGADIREIAAHENAMDDSRKRYEALFKWVISNPNFAPTFRQQVIASNDSLASLEVESDDLTKWAQGIRAKLNDKRATMQLERDKRNNAEESAYLTEVPFLNNVANTLGRLLAKEAELKRDKLISSFHGMPPFQALPRGRSQ